MATDSLAPDGALLWFHVGPNFIMPCMAETRQSLIQQSIGAGLVLVLASAAIGWTQYQEWQRGRLRIEKEQHGLKMFAFVYQNFYTQFGRSPQHIEELAKFDDGSGFDKPDRTYDLVRDGRIEVIWNADYYREPEANQFHVLAWETITPERGGLVLLAGGEVRSVSAETFAELLMLPARAE